MNKNEIIEVLQSYKARLETDVLKAFSDRGQSYGAERFNTWRRKLSTFLDDSLPGESSALNNKLNGVFHMRKRGRSDALHFWANDGEKMMSYLDSLMLDIENDEYDHKEIVADETSLDLSVTSQDKVKSKVFIVHGHNGETKERTARFIEKLGFEAIILHEQVSKGLTIIEKIEKYSDDVGFAIVLYTPDDMGNAKSEVETGNLLYRARQNVVFEHGFLMAKLGRENVAPLVEGTIELPNDISGIVYISDKDWQIDIAKEMKSSGYKVDFNQLI